MRALMQLANRHDLWVLSDEIYADITFGDGHISALQHDTEGRTLIVSGMSKSYAMTGYRVGFTRGPLDYIELASKLQEPFVSCGTGFSQLASAEALRRGTGLRYRDAGRLCQTHADRLGHSPRIRSIPLQSRGRNLSTYRHCTLRVKFARLCYASSAGKRCGGRSRQHLWRHVCRPRADFYRRLRGSYTSRRHGICEMVRVLEAA